MGIKLMEKDHLFSNQALKALLIPLIVEQLLNSLMGTIDSIMVSNVGSAAISAVSLVDSINVLMIQAFAALAGGGTIVCSQYIGQKSLEKAKESAKQLLFVVTFVSMTVMILCLVFQAPLLHLIFGQVEDAVMDNSRKYFFYTALSFPFIALYNSGASVFRAQGNSKTPLEVAVISNGLNIAGNALLIFGLHMGVAGAAIATLISRVFSAVIVLYLLRDPGYKINIRNYGNIRPNGNIIKMILRIGIPSGVENSMFQFGKLAIQSTVSTMGTTAIAAQAMANILESLNGVGACGVGIGLMTVVGECMGAGRKDEAAYYIKKLCGIAEVVIIVSCLLTFALTKPITMLGGMEKESADLCFYMVMWITIIKPIFWVPSFVPAYGLRAAGDVKFSMITACLTMWLCRVSLCVFLSREFQMGPMAVWIGMFADWAIRSVIFAARFHSGKWMNKRVIS